MIPDTLKERSVAGSLTAVRVPESKMPHPQQDELCEKLRSFFNFSESSFGSNPNDDPAPTFLVVYEPESRARISFTWSITYQANRPSKRSAEMHFIWPSFAERERDLANRLGLPAPLSTVRLPAHLTGGPRLPDLTVCPVRDAEQAANLCLMVLQQVFACDEAKWLWITDARARNERPDPLPRPNVWPPGRSASGEP
jgi:hypothetical protein